MDKVFLESIQRRLEHADSLVHGLWMAGAGIKEKPERDAIRDMAHNAGEQIGDTIGIVRNELDKMGGAS